MLKEQNGRGGGWECGREPVLANQAIWGVKRRRFFQILRARATAANIRLLLIFSPSLRRYIRDDKSLLAAAYVCHLISHMPNQTRLMACADDIHISKHTYTDITPPRETLQRYILTLPPRGNARALPPSRPKQQAIETMTALIARQCDHGGVALQLRSGTSGANSALRPESCDTWSPCDSSSSTRDEANSKKNSPTKKLTATHSLVFYLLLPSILLAQKERMSFRSLAMLTSLLPAVKRTAAAKVGPLERCDAWIRDFWLMMCRLGRSRKGQESDGMHEQPAEVPPRPL